MFNYFRYNEAPACITTCGLAPELAGDMTGAFWTGVKEQQQQTQRKRKYDEWEQIHCEMEVGGKPARQVLADYHGPDRILDLQAPQRIQHEQEPPQQARTFTDASVLLPKTPWTSYAGIGIVHNGRDVKTYPLHNIEMELTEPGNDETRRQQTMSFSINNSTRMEPTATIIATYATRPITMAVEEGSRTGGINQRDGPTSQMEIYGNSGRKQS